MKELLKKIREELMDRIKEILSCYQVIAALKIIAVLIGIASVAGIGYGIYKYQYYRGEIVWTDNYKLEDIKEDEVVMYTMYAGGGWDTRVYLALMDKRGRVKIIDDVIMDKLHTRMWEWEGTDIELYDYYMQNEDIPYEEETIEVSDEVLTDVINLEYVELTDEFSGIDHLPSLYYGVIHGSGEDRREVLVAEYLRNRKLNKRQELKPIKRVASKLSKRMPNWKKE